MREFDSFSLVGYYASLIKEPMNEYVVTSDPFKDKVLGQNKILYHYTDLCTCFSIIESDMFWARHARFSNDTSEFQLGQDTVNNQLTQPDLVTKSHLDYFITCFCENDDILSQWRGYAKSGVSLGMDLNIEPYYTIKNNESTYEYNCDLLKNQKIEKDEENLYDELDIMGVDCDRYKEILCSYASSRSIYEDSPVNIRTDKFSVFKLKPFHVFYVRDEKRESKLSPKNVQMEWEELVELKVFKKIQHKGAVSNMKVEEARIISLLPAFVKNYRFKEESEYRLVLPLTHKEYEDKVNFLKQDNIKKPFIKMVVGSAYMMYGNVCNIVIGSDVGEEIRDELVFNLEKKLPDDVEILLNHEDGSYPSLGCAVYIGYGSPTSQRTIRTIIESCLQSNNVQNEMTDFQHEKIKIWCFGHLPIRSITVGPSNHQDETVESINALMKSIYWLKDVEVYKSNIPFRMGS